MQCSAVVKSRTVQHRSINPFRCEGVPFLGLNYSEFEWFVPRNGTAVLKGTAHELLYLSTVPLL